jgi:hypothetical protein
MTINNLLPNSRAGKTLDISLLSFLPLVLATSTWHPTSSIAAAALATARDGARVWGGYSFNAPTYDEARRKALARCSERGTGCTIATVFSLKCLAVAIQVGGGGQGWATRSTLAEAKEVVLNQCRAYRRPCEIRAAVCDTVGVPATDTQVNVPAPTGPRPSLTPLPAPSTPRPRGCDLYPELCQ